MSKKLTVQAVIASREAAASANTAANEHYNAFRARVSADIQLATDLLCLVEGVGRVVESAHRYTVPSRNAARLESTANSYGFTLAEHETRKDLVELVELEAA